MSECKQMMVLTLTVFDDGSMRTEVTRDERVPSNMCAHLAIGCLERSKAVMLQHFNAPVEEQPK